MTGPLTNAGWPALAAGAALAVALLLTAGTALARAVHRARAARPRRAAGTLAPSVLAALVSVAVGAALAVAALGGIRSFDAVSARFGSPAVPLTADGMIVACTALRLAALARGWRLPGSLLVTYAFIAGTVWLNLDAATSGADKIAHALAPVSYAVLVEMLAHLLRLHLRLSESSTGRITALTWATSPVISTRAWLHLARTGQRDPAAARVLVQQVTRMSSRLRAVCPGDRPWWPFGPVQAARSAAVHTVRDGLLSAADLAALLPAVGTLTPGELLALVDAAALTAPAALTVTGQLEAGTPAPIREHVPTTPAAGVATTPTTGVPATPTTGVPTTPTTGVPTTPTTGDATTPTTGTPVTPVTGVAGQMFRTDAELLAVLAECRGPLGVRAAARQLGCGTRRARRLLAQAGLLAQDIEARAVPGRSADDDNPPSTSDSEDPTLTPATGTTQ